MQPLMRPLCKAYAEISERNDQTTGVKNKDRGRQRQRKRGREREAEKERQRKRGRDSVKHIGPPSLMQTAYAHKPKSEFILLPMRSLVFALRCSVFGLCGLMRVLRGSRNRLCNAYAAFFLIAFFSVQHNK